MRERERERRERERERERAIWTPDHEQWEVRKSATNKFPLPRSKGSVPLTLNYDAFQ